MSHWFKEKEYDLVIIGAGISGLSTAYHLNKKQPNLKIAILDKNKPFWGASGRNAGFLTIGSMSYVGKLLESTESFVEDISLNIKKLHKIIPNEVFQGENKGSLSLAYTEEELQKYYDTSKKLSKYGSSRILNKEDLLKIGLKAHGAVYYENEGSINPIALRDFLLESINADFYFGETVNKFDSKKVETETSIFKTKKVVVASNIYTKEIGFPGKEHLSLESARNQIISIKCDKRYLNSIVYSTKHLLYFRQDPDNNLIIGGARSFDPETENTMRLGRNKKILKYIHSFVSEMKIKTIGNAKEWSGIMAYTKDGLPYLGELSNDLYFLVGLNGHGMGISFSYGEKLASKILFDEDVPSDVDINRLI